MVCVSSLVIVLLAPTLESFEFPTQLPESMVAVEGARPCHEIAESGESALTSGQSLKAVQLFTLGVRKCGHGSTMLTNLAVALATLAYELSPDRQALAFCEALAAAQVAGALGADVADLTEALKSALAPSVEDACFSKSDAKGGPIVTNLSRALESPKKHANHVFEVRELCADAQAATVVPSQREHMYGVWAASNLRTIVAILRVCGVVAIKGLLPRELLARVHDASQARFEALNQTPSAQTDIASRGYQRQELKLPLLPPFTDDKLTHGPLLSMLIRLLMGERAELDTFSLIQSNPHSIDQEWHNDVELPRIRADTDPLVGLVAVVPLVDVNASNGATSFLTGSHVDMGDERFWPGDNTGDGASNSTPRVRFSAEVGTVVLFDLRLRHRGGANRASGPRPVLYMSYVQDWFRDATNFKERQSRAWDELPPAGRKLFSRLDAKRYIAQLEAELARHGVDVQSLASAADYKPGRLEL